MSKFPMTEQSTLIVQHRLNERRHAPRPRAEAAGFDLGEDGLCLECDAALTETDIENGACTQCRTPLVKLNDDEGEP